MTNPKLIDLKAALDVKRLELAGQLSGRIRELTHEEAREGRIDSTQRRSDRDCAAGTMNRFSSTLANVERALRAIEEGCYGHCIRCCRPIPFKRLQSIPWAAWCVAMRGGPRGCRRGWSRRRISMGRRPRSRSGAGLPRRSADAFGTWRRKSAEARKCMKALARSLAIALPVKAEDEAKL